MVFELLLRLVGGLFETFFNAFPYIGNVIIPTDFHSMIFQRGRSTTNQLSTIDIIGIITTIMI